jgi:hypothetical protein
MNSINDLDFNDLSEYKVVYVSLIGKNSDDKFVYNLHISTDTENTFSEGWGEKPACNIPNDILMISDDQYEYIKELKTEIKLDLAQDNCCFSMQDCRDNIVALASENLDEAEEYPENGRIVIHFGDKIDDVEKMFAQRDLITKFI